MPYTAAPLVNPSNLPSPVIFDMKQNFHALPPAVDLAPPPVPTAKLYVGIDLASMHNLGSVTNVTYSVGNQTTTGYQNRLMGSWNNMNYPITTAATNTYININYLNTIYNQVHLNYAPDPTGQYQYVVTPQYQYFTTDETPEQRLEREATYVRATIKRESADKRAEELLMCILNDAQKKQYAKFGYFETEINDRIYRIRKGHSGNVRILKNGKEIEKYCAHPSDAYAIPEHDSMIAQYLMLRTDEKAFLAKANRTVLY